MISEISWSVIRRSIGRRNGRINSNPIAALLGTCRQQGGKFSALPLASQGATLADDPYELGGISKVPAGLSQRNIMAGGDAVRFGNERREPGRSTYL
jgi:hypothetical protein